MWWKGIFMRKSLLNLILLLVLLITTGCAIGQLGHYDKENTEESKDPIEEPVEVPDSIVDQINSMSLAEKIGQMVIVGIDGLEADQNTLEMIEKYHVGGFIFFKRNIEDINQAQKLLNAIKEVNKKENNIPLFLSIDEEGGKITRMPQDFRRLPTNERIGLVNDADLSHQVGRILGEELNIFGFNMDFAPVLDVNSNPQNPVIGERAFGADPTLVSKLGLATMKGLKEENIISVVKHFPGHGDTAVDSHIGLPKVEHDLKRLESFELEPFNKAIQNDVDGIMIAHILLPQIDQNHPATLSKTIITDILRDQMKYTGVVITDDMTMGAITKNYEIGEAAIQSIKAGSDIILVCHEYKNQIRVINALTDAVKRGEISLDRVDESVYRILKLKDKYGLSDMKVEPITDQEQKNKIQGINYKINDILEITNNVG